MHGGPFICNSTQKSLTGLTQYASRIFDLIKQHKIRTSKLHMNDETTKATYRTSKIHMNDETTKATYRTSKLHMNDETTKATYRTSKIHMNDETTKATYSTSKIYMHGWPFIQSPCMRLPAGQQSYIQRERAFICK